MRTIRIKLYKFSELSKEAKNKARDNWYENEDYPFLSETLTESCYYLLNENGCTYSDIKLLYSLSYSQGDGLCFTGSISKNGNTLNLTHNYRYYFASSVQMTYTDNEGEEVDEIKELRDIYFEVCKQLEKEGYGEIEYRMTDDECSNLFEENEYEFTKDGKLN